MKFERDPMGWELGVKAHLMQAPDWLKYNLITLQIGGSHSYGLNTPTSDFDFRGIVLPPREVILNPFHKFEHYGGVDPDITIFSLEKFFKLASGNNPNTIEMLYCDGMNPDGVRLPGCLFHYRDTHGMNLTTAWERLYENRHLFLSQQSAYAFTGFSISQLRRAKLRKKACDEGTAEPRKNPIRRELEERFGYDTKAAMNTVRTMRMALEIIRDGEVRVERPDRDELLDVRRGFWTFERLEEWTLNQERIIKEIFLPRCKLPEKADVGALTKLYNEMLQDVWHDGHVILP